MVVWNFVEFSAFYTLLWHYMGAKLVEETIQCLYTTIRPFLNLLIMADLS